VILNLVSGGTPVVVHLEFLVIHREFHKSLIIVLGLRLNMLLSLLTYVQTFRPVVHVVSA